MEEKETLARPFSTTTRKTGKVTENPKSNKNSKEQSKFTGAVKMHVQVAPTGTEGKVGRYVTRNNINEFVAAVKVNMVDEESKYGPAEMIKRDHFEEEPGVVLLEMLNPGKMMKVMKD